MAVQIVNTISIICIAKEQNHIILVYIADIKSMHNICRMFNSC